MDDLLESQSKAETLLDIDLENNEVCKNKAEAKLTEASPTHNGCPEEPEESKCSCMCGKELKTLKDEVSELRNWKTARQLMDTDLTDWKGQIEKFLLSKFGFRVTINDETPTEVKDPCGTCDLDPLDPSNFENELDGFVDEQNELPDDREIIDSLNAEEKEDVEITPDLFGHFLLNNDNYEDSDENDDDAESAEEEEDEGMDVLEPESCRNLRNQKRRKRDSDSDTDCYTLSSSSSDVYSSDEEFLPQNKRGRGQPLHVPSFKQGFSGNIKIPPAKSSVQVKFSGTDNKEELMKLCRKGKGDIWECISCGFMLTSLENMLLHIKYNHSSSTHTCPYCKVVVLCRTPKDAIVHQTQCKMKFMSDSSNSRVTTVGSSRTVKSKETGVVSIIDRTNSSANVTAQLNKFVADLLEPSSSKSKKAQPLKKSKNEPPTVVTLSSDDDD